MALNILQINTTDSRGGAAKVAYLLKKELEKKGHRSPMLVGRKYSDDVDVKILNDMLSFPGKVRRKLSYWLANDIDVFSSDHIVHTEEFKKADLIHCHNLHSNYFNLGTLKKISKLKPLVWTFHDMWPITAHCAHSFEGKIQKSGFFACPSLEIYPPIAWHNEKYLEYRKNNIYENSNFHIVTPSEWLKDKVSESALKDRPISLIYNGINTDIFKPYDKDTCRKELNLPENKKIILSVIKRGQSNPWKGADYLSQIISLYSEKQNIIFICLGGDSNERNNKVINIPYTKSQKELAKYYSSADLLLYPSIADNCPLVVLEAMACGLPVVSFETGGIPELVEHKKTGYIAGYKKLEELIEGIEWSLSSQELKPQLAEKFTIQKMTESYIELYEKILNKKPL